MKRTFTLIELLIVMAMVAIIATVIAVPMLSVSGYSSGHIEQVNPIGEPVTEAQ